MTACRCISKRNTIDRVNLCSYKLGVAKNLAEDSLHAAREQSVDDLESVGDDNELFMGNLALFDVRSVLALIWTPVARDSSMDSISNARGRTVLFFDKKLLKKPLDEGTRWCVCFPRKRSYHCSM